MLEAYQDWKTSLLRSSRQTYIEQYLQDFGCPRQEAKAATFGERYGLQETLHELRSSIPVDNVRTVYNDDFSNLERRICSWYDKNSKV